MCKRYEAKKKKIHAFLLITFLLLSFHGFAYQQSYWVSDQTIASVVQLGKVYDVYLISGMPDNHSVTLEYGVPDFGNGEIVEMKREFRNVGSGVIVTIDGWLVTNAHVVDDWTSNSIIVQDTQDVLGNKLKLVAIPANPGYIWITAAREEDISGNVRRMKLLYLAKTYYIDWDYWRYDRDRAVCKIVAHAEFNRKTNLPEQSGGIRQEETFPYSKMADPFDIPIRDATISSMGFPSLGPQTFTTISKGEFIGFETAERSHLMHTAYISGGNSGGGIFFRDRLIGINTWDRVDELGRHMSVAQPVTYWAEAFAKVKLWYGTYNLPSIPRKWITSDPSTDPYKRVACVGFNLRSMAEDRSLTEAQTALENSTLVVYKKDINLHEALDYISFMEYVKHYLAVREFITHGYDLVSIAYSLNMDMSSVRTFAGMTEEQLQSTLNETGKRHFQTLKSNQFLAAYWMADRDGQVVALLPVSTDLQVTVLCDGYVLKTISFSTSSEMAQGPIEIELHPETE